VARSGVAAGGGRWADRGRRRGCRVPGRATAKGGLLLAAAGAAAATRGRRGWQKGEGEHPPRPACHLHPHHPSSSTPSGWARAVRPCCLKFASLVLRVSVLQAWAARWRYQVTPPPSHTREERRIIQKNKIKEGMCAECGEECVAWRKRQFPVISAGPAVGEFPRVVGCRTCLPGSSV
jgi:hypothetical protein